MKARYLAFFSYIGTGLRSSEKLWLKEGLHHPDPQSVQGLVEIALLKLRSLNYPLFNLSSRTDGGVHALNTSAHFDLERHGANVYDPNYITTKLNLYFYKNDINIYFRKCIKVPDDFSARHKAISRTYLYRLAVLKKDVVIPENVSIASYIPVEEWKRCYFMRLENFDILKFKEGAKYFPGYHDFTTFKKFNRLNQHKHNRRMLYSMEVKPGHPVVTRHTNLQDSIFDYWDIEIKGKSFVHNQIRRMIGTLISVAEGKIPPEEIKVMLQVPSKHSWHSHIQNCPPDGLYLCNVEYNPEDLIYEPGVTSEQSEESSNSDSE